MFWIYIPPIILIAALAALIVIIGRKSADLKKIRVFQQQAEKNQEKAVWKSSLNLIGKKSLHLLEKFLDFAKFVFRKTEQSAAAWSAKLRAKRNGKKTESAVLDKFPKEPDEARIMREIENIEEISSDLTSKREDPGYDGSGVVIRRKITEEPVVVPKKPKKKFMPEDKVKEAALIYRIAENPKDLEAYHEIGDYYLGINNIKDAKEAFKMVLKLRPRDLKAKSSLREIEMKMRLGN